MLGATCNMIGGVTVVCSSRSRYDCLSILALFLSMCTVELSLRISTHVELLAIGRTRWVTPAIVNTKRLHKYGQTLEELRVV